MPGSSGCCGGFLTCPDSGFVRRNVRADSLRLPDPVPQFVQFI